MEINIENPKNYHTAIKNLYLSVSDDEISTNSFRKSPNRLYDLLNYPQDNTMSDSRLYIKLLDLQKRARKASKNPSPDKFSRKSSRSPTNPAIKTFSGRKNIKGVKHLTVVIPEDGILLKKESEKTKTMKPFSDKIWEFLNKNYNNEDEGPVKKVRSQSFDDFLCNCERISNFDSHFYSLKRLKDNVCLKIFTL